MNKLKEYIKQFFHRILTPKGFYELELEYNLIKDLPESKSKWVKLASLYQRYNNGYLIAMSYGPEKDRKFHYEMANFYENLYNQYRKKVYE